MTAETMPLLGKPGAASPSLFTSAISSAEGKRLPQTIAHRGDKAAYPENSMGAFRGAIEVGAHAIETDLHLSKDGVVVLSHDATLKRCFGIDKKIADCDWEYLSTLKTTREPKQSMPRLSDLLEYIAQPGLESRWLLLDIKVDDDGHDLLSRVASVLASVPTPRPWNERIVLGGWNENYLTLCRTLLPSFPIALIGFSPIYASKFLSQPDVNFNMLQKTLVGPIGSRFIKAVRKSGRSLFLWTVNDEEWMEWSIRKEADGVITDDPKLFLEVCERDSGEEGAEGKVLSRRGKGRRALRVVKLYLGAFCLQVVAFVLMAFFAGRLTGLGRRKEGR
ncbi:glycerophosphoryl diester phosphodiesterase [Podospora aff. communis PSN243]|uniref:Glycerophosphoryl diester phosphodiesterase n=1 Tax=Podospora aff. communis PSN243 TaxID=3040156 RepID=A0AAV9GLG3_9PEZI|nr:glycerophosphoryl diester phosphodiesterase [Podospora aff. communis PSN243]